MSPPRPNLLVLRVADLDRAAAFYRLLGLTFTAHAHGTGPQHLAAEMLEGNFVFELYPATAEHPAAPSTRLGFAIADIDALARAVAEAHLGTVISPPKPSEWGRRAVLADPDGHRVELIQV